MANPLINSGDAVLVVYVRIFTVEQRVSSNYLHKFWKQVFAYRNDGEYTIDNLAAERAIRPQTIQRKGSLF